MSQARILSTGSYVPERVVTNTEMDIHIYPDAASLAQAAAEYFVSVAAESMSAHGDCAVMLSGGSTPRAVHARLAEDDLAGRVEWGRVHVFWGDERCVPPDHPDSNYRMARETLLERVPIPGENIRRIRGEIGPAQAALEYERVMRGFFDQAHERHPASRPAYARRHPPSFDLILLGMGDDGHTASLFPGTAALRETTRWAAAVEHMQPPPPLVARVTITPVVLNAAAHVAFIVSGAAKAERLRQVLSDPYQPDLLPAQIVRPAGGQVTWLVDEPAAAGLGK